MQLIMIIIVGLFILAHPRVMLAFGLLAFALLGLLGSAFFGF